MERRNEYGLLIGGEWVAAEGGKTSETRNPATGKCSPAWPRPRPPTSTVR